MNGLASARGAASAALRFAVVAAMLMLAAGMSQADPDGGRGSGRGGRTHGRGAERSPNGGGARTYTRGAERSPNGGGARTYTRGGDRGPSGGAARTYTRGGGPAYGGGSRTYTGGGPAYGGGSRTYIGGGRSYPDRGARIYDRGGRYYGGARYLQGGGGYYGPYGYRVIRPRTYVSFGIGLGLPYYRPPAYRYDVEPYPVVEGSSTSIDVTNEPPAGCYYYDRFCDRQFSDLDEYTDHIESQDHARTIEVVRRDSGESLWTLEFVGGVWSVER